MLLPYQFVSLPLIQNLPGTSTHPPASSKSVQENWILPKAESHAYLSMGQFGCPEPEFARAIDRAVRLGIVEMSQMSSMEKVGGILCDDQNGRSKSWSKSEQMAQRKE
jgi:hypothetical protein